MNADFNYYNSIKNNDVNDLGLLFSTTCVNPWTKRPQEIFLCENHNVEINELNKVNAIIVDQDLTIYFVQSASSCFSQNNTYLRFDKRDLYSNKELLIIFQDEFLKCLSKLLYEDLIHAEFNIFKSGFYEVCIFYKQKYR